MYVGLLNFSIYREHEEDSAADRIFGTCFFNSGQTKVHHL